MCVQLSWTNLLRKRIPSPWIPTLRGPFDAACFDDQAELTEEPVVKDADAKYRDLAKLLPADWDKEFDEPVVRPRAGTRSRWLVVHRLLLGAVGTRALSNDCH